MAGCTVEYHTIYKPHGARFTNHHGVSKGGKENFRSKRAFGDGRYAGGLVFEIYICAANGSQSFVKTNFRDC